MRSHRARGEEDLEEKEKEPDGVGWGGGAKRETGGMEGRWGVGGGRGGGVRVENHPAACGCLASPLAILRNILTCANRLGEGCFQFSHLSQNADFGRLQSGRFDGHSRILGSV